VLRDSWRSMLYRVTHPHAAGLPFPRSPSATRHSSSTRQCAVTLPLQAAWSACGACLTELLVCKIYN
jgi:hypothetical protein